jgi:hypothetical protein
MLTSVCSPSRSVACVGSHRPESQTSIAKLFLRGIAALFLGLLLVGCNQAPGGAKRAKVEGKVTVNGQPVANGFVRFMALDPDGMNASAIIKDGHYSVEEKSGPTKGKYRVEFNVPSAQKKMVPNDDVPGQFREEAPETIPAKYNTKSTIVQAIEPEKPQVLDFSLTVP